VLAFRAWLSFDPKHTMVNVTKYRISPVLILWALEEPLTCLAMSGANISVSIIHRVECQSLAQVGYIQRILIRYIWRPVRSV
jgi:hypothetical protein